MNTSSNSKVIILLVDDDKQLLDKVQSILEKLDYAVRTADDGPSGLESARSVQPDLVVLDINFTDAKDAKSRSMDGLDVLTSLRELGDIPVVMLSSTVNSAVKAMALILGATDYMSKPTEIPDIGVRIGTVLRDRGYNIPQPPASNLP